ncbi:MAG: hypothetical protein K9J13_06495 [Saprospiraceae bacterium]|nr:hypothetical protein [Saprospiraceae bacterium]
MKTLPASDLYESNKTIIRWLSDGFILKREDRIQKDIHIMTLSGQFTKAKKFIGDNIIKSVESRDELRTLLQRRNSGGVFLITI